MLKFWDSLHVYLQATILTISWCAGMAAVVLLIAVHPMIMVVLALVIAALVIVALIFIGFYEFANNRKRELMYNPKKNGK